MRVVIERLRLFQVLPDPIWWISGTLSLAGDFAVLYIEHLKKLACAKEVMP